MKQLQILTFLLFAATQTWGCAVLPSLTGASDANDLLIKPPPPEFLAFYVGSCDVGSDSSGCIQEVPAGWALLSPGVSMGAGSSKELWSRGAKRNLVVQQHEVTQGEWRAIMGTNPSFHHDCGDDCPVERVSWWDSLTYLNRLSVRDGFEPCYILEGCQQAEDAGCPAGRAWCEAPASCESASFVGTECTGYRLPNADEWRWIVEGLGDEGPGIQADQDGAAWCADVSGGRTRDVYEDQTAFLPVDGVTGNVWEWVWEEDTSNANHKTARGGSFLTSPERCRAEAKSPVVAGFRSYFLGLRPVRTLRLASEPIEAPVIPPFPGGGALSMSGKLGADAPKGSAAR